MQKVGFGIFMWNSMERRTQRYGGFYLDKSNFDGDVKVTPQLSDLSEFLGKRVKISFNIVQSRPSGHLGDLFLEIKPSQPQVDETVCIGVGTLEQESLDYEPYSAVVLKPEDGRDKLWIDPRILYRLHDQTVNMLLELTDEPFSPAPNIKPSEGEGVLKNSDNSFQVLGTMTEIKIEPKIHSLGDGLFEVSNRYSTGERVKYSKVD